jgi:hypothetical protein
LAATSQLLLAALVIRKEHPQGFNLAAHQAEPEPAAF